jgi:hypothetical protein
MRKLSRKLTGWALAAGAWTNRPRAAMAETPKRRSLIIAVVLVAIAVIIPVAVHRIESAPLVTGSSISGSSAKLVSTSSASSPGSGMTTSGSPTGSSMMSPPPGIFVSGPRTRQTPVLILQVLSSDASV